VNCPIAAAGDEQALFGCAVHFRTYGIASLLLLGSPNANQDFGERFFDELSQIHCLNPSLIARRPASVIRTRVISIVREPATTRSAVAIASPARTSSTICAIVKPWASIIVSVQPWRHEASNSSARRRSGLGRRRRVRALGIGKGGLLTVM
jgi:hypothetical protein